MLSKFSAVLMLLIAIASLVGISSIIYLPTNVETQTPLTKGLVTQKQFQSMSQVMADKQLLDRIFPQIIKRIDGKTLAAKVLPYLDPKVTLTSRPGQESRVTGTGPLAPSKFTDLIAQCSPGEIAVSGGFSAYNEDLLGYKVNKIVNPDGWSFSFHSGGGRTATAQTKVNCLNIELTLNDVQQPQPTPLPSPGGPPLQPLIAK